MSKSKKSQSSFSSKTMKKNKQKQIDDNLDSDDDDDVLSSHSKLSIHPNESLGNNIAHNLFILAAKQAREERRRHQQKTKKLPTILVKKKQLTINDIDRLFEEKCLRPSTIKSDLTNLYQNSTSRIRSMLDIHQIDQFIQTTQNRKTI